MPYQYGRVWANRSVADQITATRLQAMNQDLDALFKRLDSRNLSFTYNIQNQLTQVVDNQNSITVDLDRSDWNDPTTPKIYIQEQGDAQLFTVTYTWPGWPLQSIVYA